MEKLIDNDIIKALECCIEQGDEHFGEQWLFSIPKYLIRDVLDLINRQKAEIERLQSYTKRCESGEELWVKSLLDTIHNKDAYIERLMKTTKDAQKNCKESIDLLGKYAERLKKMRAEAIKTKSEAIKEFAERLKEKMDGFDYASCRIYDVEYIVDKLIKEMEEESE